MNEVLAGQSHYRHPAKNWQAQRRSVIAVSMTYSEKKQYAGGCRKSPITLSIS
jgi:hypothetical protein